MTLNPYYEGFAVAAAEGINTESRFAGTMQKAVDELLNNADVQVQKFLETEQTEWIGEQALAHAS